MATISSFRADLDELVRLAQIDLAALFAQAATTVEARRLLAEILPALIETYGAAATAIAADWYDDLRAQAEVSGRFTARTAPLPDAGRGISLAEWATADLKTGPPTLAQIAVFAAGGLQKAIADLGRSTVIDSTGLDPAAEGWQRSASGGCRFCRVLASDGAVYTAGTVDFGAHDNCRCVAVPVFKGRPRPVRRYTPSDRDITPADRAATRAWMRDHGYL